MRKYRTQRVRLQDATGKTRKISTYSRAYRNASGLAKLDGSTREALLIARVRAELRAHVGGNPNPVQRALIERAALLSLRVAQLDAKILAGETLTLHDNNHA